MAKQPSKLPESSPFQMVVTVLAALVTLSAISLLLIYVLNGLKDFTSATDKATDAASVAERIKPVAQVEVAASAAKGGAINAEQIVNTSCAACHGTGALSSPKIGDKSAWGPRIVKGYETLTDHAIHGFNMMPARGGNPDLSDAEIAHAVAFMANKSGASFTPPKTDAE